MSEAATYTVVTLEQDPGPEAGVLIVARRRDHGQHSASPRGYPT